MPVCGFLPVLAALFLGSNVPNPTRVTLSPFFTVFSIVSIVADNTASASFLVTFADFEISSELCVVFVSLKISLTYIK